MSARVKDVMTTRVVAVRKDATFKDIAGWLTAVYLAARDPGGHDQAAAGSAPGATAADTGSRTPAASSGREPERPSADRAAA